MTYLFQIFQLTLNKRDEFAVVVCLILAGCSSHGVQRSQAKIDIQPMPYQENISDAAKREASFFSIYNQWQGVPYRLGGTNKNGIDCSAFVQIAYRDAWQLPLPRTTKMQSKVGESINYSDAKYGDLVFFKTSKITNHVGVYLGNSRFMHASTSKGVIISRIDNPYWASKFWQFRRVDNQSF